MRRRLDWKPNFDERSKGFGVSDVIAEPETQINKSKIWQHGTILDQGKEGACVGFAWTGATIANPMPPEQQPAFEEGNSFAISVYKEAQKVDPWPGENYSGTSVLAGAKIAKEKGIIDEYRWCFSVEDLKDAVLNVGPVVIGVNWYKNMYGTDKNGLVSVSGDHVGGHAIMVTGFVNDFDIAGNPTPVFEWVNSWGPGYGKGGRGYIKYKDMEKLVGDMAEMCVPIKKNTPVLFGPNPIPEEEKTEPIPTKDNNKKPEIKVNPSQLMSLFSGLVKIITDIFKGKK